jgi:hypothetical protein
MSDMTKYKKLYICLPKLTYLPCMWWSLARSLKGSLPLWHQNRKPRENDEELSQYIVAWSMSSTNANEQVLGRPRQQPGSAYEECRRRKLRCDREYHQCGICVDAGIPCNVRTSNPPRGPKKGHLKALRSQISKGLAINDILERYLTVILYHNGVGNPSRWVTRWSHY